MMTTPPGPTPAPIDPYAKAKVKLLDGSSGIAYVESGNGGPVIFVHGSLCDFRYWRPQLFDLSSSYRSMAISLSHHFPRLPSSIGKPFSWNAHVAQIAAFVTKLGGARVHLVGHSRGACIAYQVALRHPHLAASLTLVDPGGPNEVDASDGHDVPPDVRDIRSRAVHLIAEGRIEEGLRMFVESTSRTGFWDRSASVFQSMARDNALTLGPQIADPLPLYKAEEAATISCPTLLTQGERSPLMYRRNADLLTKWIHGATSITMPGASHGMTWSHPQAFNRHLRSFLTGISG